jgi:hypothetical protein
MRFNPSFIRFLFLQPTSLLDASSPTFSLPSDHGILDSTTLAPRHVHRCPTYFIILLTGGLHGTNVGNLAKAISLPYRNVYSSSFIVS